MRRYVEIIHDQGERLAGIAEGFLDAEETERTRLELESAPVDLGDAAPAGGQLIARESAEHRIDVELPDRDADRRRRP